MNRKSEFMVSADRTSQNCFQLCGNDAITLLEFIRDSIRCETKEDYLSLFPKIRELLPFDFANSFMAHHDSDNRIVMVYGVNIGFPKEWLKEYMAKDYLQKDVTVRENFATYKVQHWDGYRLKLHEQDEELISLCVNHGMNECCTLGSRLVITGENGSMFCFTGRSMEYDRRIEAILEFVTPHLHLALYNLYSNRQLEQNRIVISQRETEVLNWLKKGKSSWDISVILRISESTVNYHIYNIVQKLGVVNRAQALAVAAHMGLLNFE